jgi:hypothetical protein
MFKRSKTFNKVIGSRARANPNNRAVIKATPDIVCSGLSHGFFKFILIHAAILLSAALNC